MRNRRRRRLPHFYKLHFFAALRFCVRLSNPAIMSNDLLEAEKDFVGAFGANGAGDFSAVFEEDGRWPEFYPEGAAERAAGAVFDFDVLDRREFGEGFGDVRGRGLAVAAPTGAEFEEDRAAGGVDFFARGAGVLVIRRHIRVACLSEVSLL